MLTESQKERLKIQGKKNLDARHNDPIATQALEDLIENIKEENPDAFLTIKQLHQRKFFHQPSARVPLYYFLIPCPSDKLQQRDAQ